MIKNTIGISPTKYIYTNIINSEKEEDDFLLSMIFICTNEEKTISAEWFVGSNVIYIFKKSPKQIYEKTQWHPILGFIEVPCIKEYFTHEPMNILIKNAGAYKEIFEHLQTYADVKGV